MPDKFTLIKEIFKINDKIINLIKLLFNNSLKEIKHNDHIFKEAVYSKTSRDFVSHPQINSTLMYNNKVYGSSSVSTHSYPYTDINNTVNVYPSAVYNTSINGFNKKQY
jgi:hypothetical protein